MKKFLSALIIFCALALPGLVPQKIEAAGVSEFPHAKLSASVTSATADGGSTITITATFYVYECNNTNSVGYYYTGNTPSGCDNYGGVRGEKLFTNYGQPCPYQDTITVDVGVSGDATLSKSSVCGGASGTDSFTVKSSVAGTKTLTPTTSWTHSGSTIVGSGVSVTFNAPAKPKTTTPAPVAAPAAPTPPQTPALSTLTVDGSEVKTDQAVSVEENKPLVLSGKTVANGKVTLYVFSDPKQFTTTADKDGNWSVSVEGLPVGDHHAEVEVSDPATNQTSARAKLLEFSVVAAQKVPAAVTQKSVKSSKVGLWIGLAVILVLACGAAGFLFWRRKRAAKNTANPDHPASTPDGSSSDSAEPPNEL